MAWVARPRDPSRSRRRSPGARLSGQRPWRAIRSARMWSRLMSCGAATLSPSIARITASMSRNGSDGPEEELRGQIIDHAVAQHDDDGSVVGQARSPRHVPRSKLLALSRAGRVTQASVRSGARRRGSYPRRSAGRRSHRPRCSRSSRGRFRAARPHHAAHRTGRGRPRARTR